MSLRFPFLTLTVIGATVLSGCLEIHEEKTPQPNGDLTAVLIFEMHQGTNGSFAREALVETTDGRRSSIATGAKDDGLGLGGWNADGSLGICIRSAAPLPRTVTTPDGRSLTIRADCSRR